MSNGWKEVIVKWEDVEEGRVHKINGVLLTADLDNTAKVILQDHIESCVAHAMTHGEEGQVLEDLRKALEHFIR
ncbi:metal-sensing transcriptional repressor [Tumebacillus permanentifrigoris]|uniref:Metal-sensitive transcriptional repressor n=1 Tax=Tumebacillus permanentifrigoris TaxID=378543 RepID=A0A316DE33_9BACL|nr:metal-sensing transcriptional repressor [Tumebacillus permanentifrigoris]PWK15050.1 hypothetical protein C7459_104257 [Tumebacillus permanentifrigoris]